MYFVDLEKTSVSVNINLLLYKSLKININSKFLQLIKSLYQDVHTCSEIDTNSFPVKVGTRQGYNLSQDLFNIFVSDFPNFLRLNNSG